MDPRRATATGKKSPRAFVEASDRKPSSGRTAPDRRRGPAGIEQQRTFAGASHRKSSSGLGAIGATSGHVKPLTVPGALRRSLKQLGGKVEVWAGEAAFGRLLTDALEVDLDDASGMQHVHGFHTYPARMHPQTAARLVRGLSEGQAAVLDPFMGSGTVLVEARLLGRRPFGIDANPLAVALSELKVNGFGPKQRELWTGAVEAIAEHADLRRCSKAGPTRRYAPLIRDAFDPHVLMELDGLAQGIRQLAPPELAPALLLVLSSLVVKVSRRRSDTSQIEVARRLASGFVIRFFAKKAVELLFRLDDYERRLEPRAPVGRIQLGDARQLPFPDASVAAIVTSPPYPGVYDYVEHHRLRMEWLELDPKHLERHEIGAHRNFARRSDSHAEAEWAKELGDCLIEMLRVLAPAGTAAILIADSALAGRAWFADRAVPDLARRCGLAVVGGASQSRGHFHARTQSAFANAERREHLILLQRDPKSSRSSGSRQDRRPGPRGPRHATSK